MQLMPDIASGTVEKDNCRVAGEVKEQELKLGNNRDGQETSSMSWHMTKLEKA